MNKLNYFKGKVCTVLTAPANRFFDDTQHVNVFVGLVEDVDELGVWIVQLTEKKKSFFRLNAIVGIIEETVTFFNDEEVKEAMNKLEATLPTKDNQKLISLESIKKVQKNISGGK